MADPEKILIADGEPQLLAQLSEFLGNLGYAVLTVADGRQALQAVQEEEFHLALLDLNLPGTPALELLSSLKERTPHTEVIIFTSQAEMDSAIQALRRGAYDYLVKSEMRLDNLQAVVSRALERRRLELRNRELLAGLRRAQRELSRQRAQDLSRVRRLGETLAVPHTWEQLFHGLLNLIWESIPFKVLGLEFQGAGKEISLEAYHCQPGVKQDTVARVKTWVKKLFHVAVREGSAPPAKPGESPLPQVLTAAARGGECLALIAGGRDTPFTPEETELFRILILQGEAALKNLELFEEIKSLAIRDGLTGLYNYRHFWEVLAHEVEQSRRYRTPLSLLFLDLDNFKVINDAVGHSHGDLVLKALTEFLQGALRHADVVCRYGGEEFVVLLPRTQLGQAMKLAERLRQKISRMVVPLPEMDVQFTVSIGVAGLSPGIEGEALVEAADAAMYRAKKAGKNKVCGPE